MKGLGALSLPTIAPDLLYYSTLPSCTSAFSQRSFHKQVSESGYYRPQHHREDILVQGISLMFLKCLHQAVALLKVKLLYNPRQTDTILGLCWKGIKTCSLMSPGEFGNQTSTSLL